MARLLPSCRSAPLWRSPWVRGSRSMSMDERARAVFAAAVDGVQPDVAVRRSLERRGDRLLVAGQTFSLRHNLHLVGFGKAVLGMAAEAERIVGDHLAHAAGARQPDCGDGGSQAQPPRRHRPGSCRAHPAAGRGPDRGGPAARADLGWRLCSSSSPGSTHDSSRKTGSDTPSGRCGGRHTGAEHGPPFAVSAQRRRPGRLCPPRPGERMKYNKEGCEPCPKNQYKDNEKDSQFCVRCKQCSQIPGTTESSSCTPISDTVCTCLPGFIHLEKEAGCVCPKGYGVQSIKVTKCIQCDSGFFSDKADMSMCQKWKRCGQRGVKMNGSRTSDVVCYSEAEGKNMTSPQAEESWTTNSTWKGSAITHPPTVTATVTQVASRPLPRTSPTKSTPPNNHPNYGTIALFVVSFILLSICLALTCKLASDMRFFSKLKKVPLKGAVWRKPVEESGDKSSSSVICTAPLVCGSQSV
ncbi:glycerate kinase isoform X2 [Denticeps clupeoides]|uniref:glycerate kinase isoform X2 n=1 Tax=Denticeps clupeoides TaxID=299321 RepID=UPI0010A4F901|nr:glycerate kinase isoform X2 [Denticeps clupeoides]